MAAAPAERAKPKDDAQHSGRLLLRLPPALHSELAQAAERECVSLNSYITQKLSAALGGEEPAAASGASRFLRIAIVADLVMVAIATVAVIALVIVAWP